MIARICAILCGVAFTWACAAFGLNNLVPHGCGGGVRLARMRVREIVEAVRKDSLDRHECAATRETLIEDGYIRASGFVDPWGTGIVYSCSTEGREADPKVRSAGPDRLFNTADDITND